MGGGKVKHRFLDVVAWRAIGSDYVFIATRTPVRDLRGWSTVGPQVCICPRIFKQLSGVATRKAKGMAPVRIRVPAWTVLKGGDDG